MSRRHPSKKTKRYDDHDFYRGSGAFSNFFNFKPKFPKTSSLSNLSKLSKSNSSLSSSRELDSKSYDTSQNSNRLRDEYNSLENRYRTCERQLSNLNSSREAESRSEMEVRRENERLKLEVEHFKNQMMLAENERPIFWKKQFIENLKDPEFREWNRQMLDQVEGYSNVVFDKAKRERDEELLNLKRQKTVKKGKLEREGLARF